jgi:hypothetical protein
MNRLTYWKQVWVVVLATFLGWGAETELMAALNSSILNGGFESGTLGSSPAFTAVGVGTPNAGNPNWAAAAGGLSYGEGVWVSSGGPGSFHDNSVAPVFPAFTGIRAGSLISDAFDGDPAKNVATLFQSLGTVDASDVGKTFFLSADMGARAFPNRSYTGDMTVRFAVGANAATAVGTPGVINVVTNPGLVALPAAFPLTTATASFSPSAGDIGTQVFAAIHLQNITAWGGDQNQYMVDNVSLSVVPEPAGIALVIACGMWGVMYRRRGT